VDSSIWKPNRDCVEQWMNLNVCCIDSVNVRSFGNGNVR
jgi:hypothetical protein